MIQLISAFRNGVGRLPVYAAMVESLHRLTLARTLLVVGDSTDGTLDAVRHLGVDYFVHDHGRPEYGSCEEPDRLTALSGLLNASLEEARRYITDDDTVIWVEGDLYWDPWTLLRLADYTRTPGIDVIAPMVFAGEAHYDTWAVRTLDGRRYGPFWPYGDLADFTQPAALVECSSVGSVVAMKGIVAKTIRVSDGNALVGWCHAARAAGYRVWLAKELRCQHPYDRGQ